MMPRIRPEIPNINGKLETIKQMLVPLHIKNLNQSEKMQILELVENLLQNYNLVEFNFVIDELLENLPINDIFSLKLLYYKARKESLCLNIAEANKFINLGLNKINTIVEKDKNLDITNKLLTIEKYKCDYLSGIYQESLDYYLAFERKFDLDQLIKIEVSLNAGSIYLLTGDIQSGINIYKNSFDLVKQLEKNFLQVKISHLLGDCYQKIGNFEYSKNFYKLSLSYAEEQNNLYYVGKALVKLFIMDHLQDSNIVDNLILLKLKNYQKQVQKSDFFSKIISICLSDELGEKITRLKNLKEDFNDQITEPEILVLVIESLIIFQLESIKRQYSEVKVDEIHESIDALENVSKKYNLTFYSFKGLLVKSKIKILSLNFSESIQILQDGIASAENLKLTAYSKFFKSEIEKINLLSPLYQPSKNNPTVAEMLHVQQIFSLMDLFNNFAYRLSLFS